MYNNCKCHTNCIHAATMTGLQNHVAHNANVAIAADCNAVDLQDMSPAGLRRQTVTQRLETISCNMEQMPQTYYSTSVIPMPETYPSATRLHHKYNVSNAPNSSSSSSSSNSNSSNQAVRLKKQYFQTSLSMTYTQNSIYLLLRKHTINMCKWNYWRWSLFFGASVLLFFVIAYCLWLRELPHVAAASAIPSFSATASASASEAQPNEAMLIATLTNENDATTIVTTTTTSTGVTKRHPLLESTILRTIGFTTRQRSNGLNITTHTTVTSQIDAKEATEWPNNEITQSKEAKSAEVETTEQSATWSNENEMLLEPDDIIETATAFENLTNISMQRENNSTDDELKKEITYSSSSTTATPFKKLPFTNVSPTIPPLRHWMPTTAMPVTRNTLQQENGCRSTSLLMCQGVLDYDLTNSPVVKLNDDERQAFQMLSNSNCSERAIEFVCTVLEPECRPIGMLPPCRRICKAILEACSIVVSSSDVLTAVFDCSSYPDSNEPSECEDPTRRRNFCYDTEFACEDQSCIPQMWQCDNIKDCAVGEDEDSCLMCGQQDEFRCRSNEKCIPAAKRCDRSYDCFDGSDEKNCDDYLFSEDFSLDSFYTPSTIAFKDGLYSNDADAPSTLFSKYNEMHSVLNFNRSTGISKEEISNIVTSESKAQGFVHFRDSKEIMMTSDTENKFKYSTSRGNRTYANKNGNANNNNNNNNNATTSNTNHTIAVGLSKVTPLTEAPKTTTAANTITAAVAGTVTATTTTTTTTAAAAAYFNAKHIATATTRQNCEPHQLRCVSGDCITVQQICDKKIDCPDGADELMCVYKERNIVSMLSSGTTTRQPLEKRKTTIRILRGGQYQQHSHHQ